MTFSIHDRRALCVALCLIAQPHSFAMPAGIDGDAVEVALRQLEQWAADNRHALAALVKVYGADRVPLDFDVRDWVEKQWAAQLQWAKALNELRALLGEIGVAAIAHGSEDLRRDVEKLSSHGRTVGALAWDVASLAVSHASALGALAEQRKKSGLH